jgi:hypothetical protein
MADEQQSTKRAAQNLNTVNLCIRLPVKPVKTKMNKTNTSEEWRKTNEKKT